MRPGVGADGVAGRGHLLENFRMIGGVLADREEHRLGAFVRQRLEHGRRIDRPRTVIEGQHDFLVGQKIELLEMLEAETGSARGVDLDDAADAERIGIGASGLGLRSNRRAFPEWPRWSRRPGARRRPWRRPAEAGRAARRRRSAVRRCGARRSGPEPYPGDHNSRYNTSPASGLPHFASFMFPNYALRADTSAGAINEKQVLTPHQRSGCFGRLILAIRRIMAEFLMISWAQMRCDGRFERIRTR